MVLGKARRVFLVQLSAQPPGPARTARLEAVALFLLLRAAHGSAEVRDYARRLVLAMASRFPELLWSERCLLRLADLLDVLVAYLPQGLGAAVELPASRRLAATRVTSRHWWHCPVAAVPSGWRGVCPAATAVDGAAARAGGAGGAVARPAGRRPARPAAGGLCLDVGDRRARGRLS